VESCKHLLPMASTPVIIVTVTAAGNDSHTKGYFSKNRKVALFLFVNHMYIMNSMEEKKTRYHISGGVKVVVMFFILLFVFAKWGPAINFNSVTQTTGQPFVVTGTGKATVAPDIAKIDFGISETGTDLKTLQNSVDQKSQSLVAQIKKLGIADKDIQTTSYSVYPQYDYTAPVQRITGYQVSTNYEVTIRDFTKINDLIATVTSNGANNISGVNFDLSDTLKNQTMQTAREQAVAEAKTKAEGLAKAAGITLGKIINVSEETPSNIIPLPLAVSGGGEVTTKSVTPPSVQPGTTEIDITVSLSYEVR
jgi:uncharacterized protein